MTTEPTARSLPREPLGDPHLRRLIVGQGLAAVVDALFLIWLTLFVLELAEPGIATGFVLVAVALPRAALLLPAGVLVDRLAPGRVAAGAAWLRVAVLLALGALVTFTSPSVTTVALLSGMLGAADAAYFPAALALLPAVVPTEKLARVNALVQGAESGGDLVGPAVAAGVIAAVGFAATLGGIAAMAALAAVALSTLIRVVRRGEGAGDDAGPGAVDGERLSSARALGAGLGYAWHEPLVRGMLAAIALINIAVVGPVLVGGAVLADQRLGGAGSLGVVLSGFGAGSLAGSLVAGWRPPARRGWTVVGGVAAIGAGMAGLSAVTHVMAATAVVSLIGVGSAFLGVVVVAALQERVPERLLGRVMSLVVLATVALDPFSYVVAGVLLPYGTTTLFLVCGGAVLGCAGLVAASPAIRSLR
ncbi:transporter [Streptomyces eurocidicus]|uniref:MFS family permease n=1 Tax=Streptomyces eurocidicus TaxID=66423 RepID=A0A2N8P072_STREU|nr:MFS transporter [Streptomyces eurocidicus]MBB5118953.1 MFS family permease [Streptomyces eurocidicus]MBF6051241.1 MFS transporter [Streptomyces eurocidicus]PNE34411.1 transporter [Streptomyces eurocidicus]